MPISSTSTSIYITHACHKSPLFIVSLCVSSGYLASHLSDIGMEEDLVLLAQPANLLQRLHHPDLIVDPHDRDERGLARSDRSLQLTQVD